MNVDLLKISLKKQTGFDQRFADCGVNFLKKLVEEL